MGYAEEYRWAQTVQPCDNAEDFAGEAIWVILCSGMKAEIARQIERRVWSALKDDKPVNWVFGHRLKARAIEQIWHYREELFLKYQQADDKVAFLETIDGIGPITKFHLAKNLGFDVAKPDRWLQRLAAWTGETVDGLCERLAFETGDRVATVDLILWRACNQGLMLQAPDGTFEHLLAAEEA